MTKKTTRGKTRAKNSSYPFSGIGLKPEEDQRLIKMLEEHDLSARQLLRALIRQWMEQGGRGTLSMGENVIAIRRVGK